MTASFAGPLAPRVRLLRGERSRAVVDVLVVLVTVGLGLLPLVPVYGATAAARPAVGGLLLGAALALVAARLRWGALVTSVAGVAVYLLAGAALATPTVATAGVLPSRRSLALLLTGAVTVWKQVLTLDPALGASGNLLVAPFLLALVAATVATSIAVRAVPRRHGAWAAVIPPAVLGVSVLLGTKDTVAPAVAGVVMAALLLAWVAWRRRTLTLRRPLALLVMASVAAAGGGLAGPLLAEQHPRYVLRDELVPPFDPREQASPLSSFRRYIKEWKDTELLVVRGLPPGAVVRLATMDSYDGVVWNVGGAESAEGSGSFRRVGDTIRTAERGERLTVQMEALDLPSVWLPTVGYTERFRFEGPGAAALASDLRYNDATGTAVLMGGVPRGTRWSADVVVPPSPEDEEIGAASPGQASLPRPQGVPEAVPLLAGEISGTATSPVLIARSLEAGLADRGWFSHGVGPQDYPSLSGHGADRITTLLTGDLMVGDGEQYASAMALMAREMGLPSRVVLGFEPTPEQEGAQEIRVTGEDVQAWVEISFAGHGWVRFEPTPDETKTPRQDTPEDQAEPQPQVMQPPPPPEEPVQPPDEDTEEARTSEPPEEAVTESHWQAVLVAAGAALVPLTVVLGPLALIAALKRRRRRRRRADVDPVRRVVGAWDELLDQAKDMRRPPPGTATRREIAVGLADAFRPTEGRRAGRRRSDASGRRDGRHEGRHEGRHDGGRGSRRGGTSLGRPIAALAATADEVVFGPGQPSPEQVEAYWGGVDDAVRAMRAQLPAGQRWWAAWSTASLRSRRSERPVVRARRRARLRRPGD